LIFAAPEARDFRRARGAADFRLALQWPRPLGKPARLVAEHDLYAAVLLPPFRRIVACNRIALPATHRLHLISGYTARFQRNRYRVCTSL
jgi:hypothetical protein